MLAIDWQTWLQNPAAGQKMMAVTPTDLLWEDAVTGTLFKIAEDEYWRLRNKLQEALNAADGEERYAILSKKYLPFGRYTDLEAAIHLPYPAPLSQAAFQSANQRTRTRIADHVLLRTGLYYAIHHPQLEQWEQLRSQLLQIESELSEEIDLFLLKGQWRSLQDHKVDLVKGGAVKIKEYIVETNSIQEVRGGSILLDEINQQRIEQLCRTYWTPEILVYSGGGNFLLIVPQEHGPRAAYLIEDMFRKITISARGIATYAQVSLNALAAANFRQTFSWLEMKKTERQMTLIPQEQQQAAGDINLYRKEKMAQRMKTLPVQKDQPDGANSFATSSGQLICQLCQQRDAVHYLVSYKGEQPAACLSCTHKIIAGKNVTAFVSEMKEVLNRTGVEVSLDDFTDTLEELKEGNSNDYIGVIYGDGNNMGQIVGKIHSLTMYRYFSHLVDSVAKYAVYTALYEVLGPKFAIGNKANFEIIAVGGDDVFFMVPGEYALEVARKMGEKFEQALKCCQAENEHLTITLSVGVALGDYKLPFTRLFQTASELLKSAKAFRKRKKENGNMGGTIDFMKLKSSTPYAGGLKNYRQLHFQRTVTYAGREVLLQQIMRPYTFAQIKDLEQWLEELKKHVRTARSLIYRLAEITDTMTIQEAKLFYLYHICSQSGTNKDRLQFKNLLAKRAASPLAKEANWLLDDMYFYDKEQQTVYSPWDDLAEIWDVKEG